jgi:serine/threonine-protein kinase
VVIKRLLPEYSRRKAYVRLFLAEARTGALLNHPNIVALYDLGQLDDAYFMAMEYVHGVSAAEILAKSTQAKKPVPIGAAIRIVGSAAEALHYAHHAPGLDGQPLGIIHHDISPQNIQVSFDGDVKLLDFGVATRRGQKAMGGRRGKYGYMSPEAMERGELDQRSDLFSLGVVLYELTMGRRLFKGEGTDPPTDPKAPRQVEPPTRQDPYYPASLEEVLLKALATDPAERFPDAMAFQRALVDVGRKLGVSTGSEALATYLAELFGDEVAKRRAELGELAGRSDPKPRAEPEAPKTEAAPAEAAEKPMEDAPAPKPPEEEKPDAPAAEAEAEPSGVDVDLDDDEDLEEPGAGPEASFEAPPAVLAQEARWDAPAAPAVEAAAWRRAALALAAGGIVLALATLFIGRYWGDTAAVARADLDHGSLVVESDPAGARVFDGERLLGITPMTAAKVPVGTRYDLRLVQPGFVEHHAKVDVTAERRDVVVAVTLRPEPPPPPPPAPPSVAGPLSAAPPSEAAAGRPDEPGRRHKHADDAH